MRAILLVLVAASAVILAGQPRDCRAAAICLTGPCYSSAQCGAAGCVCIRPDVGAGYCASID